MICSTRKLPSGDHFVSVRLLRKQHNSCTSRGAKIEKIIRKRQSVQVICAQLTRENMKIGKEEIEQVKHRKNDKGHEIKRKTRTRIAIPNEAFIM